jgi:hypothetical protein
MILGSSLIIGRQWDEDRASYVESEDPGSNPSNATYMLGKLGQVQVHSLTCKMY